MSVPSTRPQVPVGRPTHRHHTVTLPDVHWDKALALGRGNASRGIRLALDRTPTGEGNSTTNQLAHVVPRIHE